LYSREFYAELKRHLKPNGIVAQWYPNEPGPILAAVTRTADQSFSYARVFRSAEGWGYHLLLSQRPIHGLTANEIIGKMPASAQADLEEWNRAKDRGPGLKEKIDRVLASEVKISELYDQTAATIEDDRPFNEYYLVRKNLGAAD
jgi:hypothetical protein